VSQPGTVSHDASCLMVVLSIYKEESKVNQPMVVIYFTTFSVLRM
jgi:hypothetical protein